VGLPKEAIMSKLTLIIGACLLISTAGCAYYDGYGYPNSSYYGYGYRSPYYGYGSDGYAYRWHRHHHHHYYNYGFWQDR
jgi:hypothetical protein